MEQEPSVEGRIEELLTELREFGWVFNECPELQDEWYDIETEAEVSADREEAAERLGEFLGKVKTRAEEKKDA